MCIEKRLRLIRHCNFVTLSANPFIQFIPIGSFDIIFDYSEEQAFFYLKINSLFALEDKKQVKEKPREFRTHGFAHKSPSKIMISYPFRASLRTKLRSRFFHRIWLVCEVFRSWKTMNLGSPNWLPELTILQQKCVFFHFFVCY